MVLMLLLRKTVRRNGRRIYLIYAIFVSRSVRTKQDRWDFWHARTIPYSTTFTSSTWSVLHVWKWRQGYCQTTLPRLKKKIPGENTFARDWKGKPTRATVELRYQDWKKKIPVENTFARDWKGNPTRGTILSNYVMVPRLRKKYGGKYVCSWLKRQTYQAGSHMGGRVSWNKYKIGASWSVLHDIRERATAPRSNDKRATWTKQWNKKR